MSNYFLYIYFFIYVHSHIQSVYEIEKICACEVIDDKNPQRTVFRVVRISKDSNYKNVDFEAQVSTASKCIAT